MHWQCTGGRPRPRHHLGRIHAVPFTAEVMRITRLVPDAMAHAWEQVFLSAREDDYMALMEATSAWQNS